MIKKILNKENKCIAIFTDFSDLEDGIKFITEDEDILQLGAMSRPKDYKIIPHKHNKVKRESLGTNEVLFLKFGKVKVNFYDKQDIFLESYVMKPGEWVILKDDGHGFEMLEKSFLIEVKNGPYVGIDDKVRFDA